MSEPASSCQRHAVEHRADAFGDRQLHADAPRQIAQHRRGGQPFDDLADLRPGLVGGRAARDQLSGAAVAAERVEARCDQIAHAGEARERLRLGSAGLPEPRHLDETTGDEGRLRVVAEAEPVDGARREGDHVLRRAAELDPDHVAVDVDAERARVDRVLQAQRERFVLGCDHGGARQARRDLLRHVRPREHRHGATLHQGREPVAGRRIEALDEAEDRRVAANSCQHLAERAARDRDDDDVGLLVRRVVERHARRDEHVVAAVAEQTAEHLPPRARADDDESHERSRKSTTTGTPSRLKRSRSWFSTQYA